MPQPVGARVRLDAPLAAHAVPVATALAVVEHAVFVDHMLQQESGGLGLVAEAVCPGGLVWGW